MFFGSAERSHCFTMDSCSLSHLYCYPNDHVPPIVGWNALALLAVLLLISIVVGFWDWLVNLITTYGQNLHPYPMLYRLLGVLPLSTGGSPWVRVEMENDQVVTGRVIEFGLEAPDAGSLVLVMVAILRGDDVAENRPAEERWYIPQKSIRGFSVEYVKPHDNGEQQTSD